ncbi:MAG TPA: lysophospholipid acyltransferase family protein [Mycobacteriales bacterium]|nr:lysophospholipid acyltransferase family protein [Mycobacteriales bacterium]
MSVLYWVVKVVLTPVLHLLWRPTASGRKHLPRSGPAILAGNHTSYLDWIFLPLMCPRKISFLAKSDYFTGRGLKGKAQKFFFAGTGQVPVVRAGGSASAAALIAARKVLDEGRLFGIFPEGTRTPDGRLYRGKTGVARLALESGAPVIPCATIGLFDIAPPGARIPKVRRVGVRFGEPLDFSRYAGRAGERDVLRAVTDEIMQAIQALSGQEYVDRYASTAKAAAARAQRAGGTAGASSAAKQAEQVEQQVDQDEDEPLDEIAPAEDEARDEAQQAR